MAGDKHGFGQQEFSSEKNIKMFWVNQRSVVGFLCVSNETVCLDTTSSDFSLDPGTQGSHMDMQRSFDIIRNL